MTSKEALSGQVVVVDSLSIDSGLSLSELVALLWRSKFLLILAGFLGAASGYGMSYAFKPKYDAVVTMIWAGSDQEQSLLGGLGSQFSSLIGAGGLAGAADSARLEAMARMRSRTLTQDFIAQQNLMPVLYERFWDDAKGGWRSSVAESPPSSWDAFQYFDADVRSIDEQVRLGLIELKVRWYTPDIAARWANEYVELANRTIRESHIENAKRSLQFLRAQLEKQESLGLRSTLYRMIEGQLNAIMLAEVRPDFAFRVIDPAVAPDLDDRSFPNRALFFVLGGIVGGGLALIFIFVRRSSNENE